MTVIKYIIIGVLLIGLSFAGGWCARSYISANTISQHMSLNKAKHSKSNRVSVVSKSKEMSYNTIVGLIQVVIFCIGSIVLLIYGPYYMYKE